MLPPGGQGAVSLQATPLQRCTPAGARLVEASPVALHDLSVGFDFPDVCCRLLGNTVAERLPQLASDGADTRSVGNLSTAISALALSTLQHRLTSPVAVAALRRLLDAATAMAGRKPRPGIPIVAAGTGVVEVRFD